MTAVRYVEATRTYPGTDAPAVDSLSLDIADGELLVLVGPSGSGKSTALRMLAGLEPLDAGAIHIGDRDVSNVRPRDRDIAMVFQNYALYPQLSVAENMGFALKQHGVPKEERTARVRETARILDLEPFLDRKPRQLSGGQRQRVAMGRAIVRQPAVYLMDEPLSNLDAKLRVQTRTEVVELQARLEPRIAIARAVQESGHFRPRGSTSIRCGPRRSPLFKPGDRTPGHTPVAAVLC